MNRQFSPSTQTERFAQDESGAVLVEFAIVLSLFILMLFGFIDFGRLAFSYVMGTKATEVAVRMAVVSTPVCSGLPATNQRGAQVGTSTTLGFGASCSTAIGLCSDPGTLTCDGSLQSPTAVKIWAQIQDLMPNNATIGNLQFSYSFDPNVGFLGGPYTPIVTVSIRNLDFEFISPLGTFASLSGATDYQSLGATFRFPGMSASLPAEDLR